MYFIEITVIWHWNQYLMALINITIL